MARRIVGIDIGTYSIKVVHTEQKSKSAVYQIGSFVEKPLVYSKNPQEEQNPIQTALAELKAEGHLEGDVFIAGLPARAASMLHVFVPFTDAKKIEAVLPGILDSQLPFEIDDIVFSWFLTGKTAEGEHEVAVAVAKKDAVSDTIADLQKVIADPRILHLKTQALFDFGLPIAQSKKITGYVAVVDIGYTTTGICIFNADRVVTSRAILRGEKETSYVLREIKNTLQALRTKEQIEVSHIFLVGGGSAQKGLEEEWNTQLHVPVQVVSQGMESITDAYGSVSGFHGVLPQGAQALGYAVSGFSLQRTTNRFNFRKGEFSFRGGIDYIRPRIKALSIWGGIIFGLLCTGFFVRSSLLGKELQSVQTKQLEQCERIIHKDVSSSSQCLAIIQEQIAKQNDLRAVEFSAAEVFVMISNLIPSNLQVDLSELDITDENVRIKGVTSSFDAIDQLVEVLSKGRCFASIDKGRASQIEKGVDFQLTIKLDCAKKPS